MKLVKQDIGVWVKADVELPNNWLFKAVRLVHTKIIICDIENQLEVRPEIIHLIEWLKPFKEVYVLTEDELNMLIKDAMLWRDDTAGSINENTRLFLQTLTK